MENTAAIIKRNKADLAVNLMTVNPSVTLVFSTMSSIEVSCTRSKFQKNVKGLKAFCSLSDYFGDARFQSKKLSAKDLWGLVRQGFVGTCPPRFCGDLSAKVLWRIKQLLIFIRQSTLADCSARLFPKILEFRSQKLFNRPVWVFTVFYGT
jgi:hypothetical protein